MDILKEIMTFTLGTLTVSGAIIAIIAFISRSMFNTWMEKGVEKYRHDLSMEAEKHRSIISIEAKQNEIKFLRLHEERAYILKELYKKVVSLHLASESLYRAIVGKKQYEEQEVMDAIILIRNGYQDLREFSYYNAIFFEKELYSQIDILIDSFVLSNLAVVDKDIEKITIEDLKKLYRDELDVGVKVSDVVEYFNKSVVNKLKAYIEDEFRGVLGINNNNVEKRSIMQMTEVEA